MCTGSVAPDAEEGLPMPKANAYFLWRRARFLAYAAGILCCAAGCIRHSMEPLPPLTLAEASVVVDAEAGIFAYDSDYLQYAYKLDLKLYHDIGPTPPGFKIPPGNLRKMTMYILHPGINGYQILYDSESYFLLTGTEKIYEYPPRKSVRPLAFTIRINGRTGRIQKPGDAEWRAVGYLGMTQQEALKLIKVGMSEADVAKLLGPGYLSNRVTPDSVMSETRLDWRTGEDVETRTPEVAYTVPDSGEPYIAHGGGLHRSRWYWCIDGSLIVRTKNGLVIGVDLQSPGWK